MSLSHPAQWILTAILATTYSGCEVPASKPSTTANNPADDNSNEIKSSPTENQSTAATKDAGIKVTAVDFAGFEAEVAKLKGKLVVVDVWSTGCPPCMKEYPNLVELSKRWPDKVACVSLNVDYIGQKSKPVESYLPKVSGFLEKQKSIDVVNLISSEADSDVFEKLEIASIPVIMLYDREGKLLKKFTEANSGEDGLTYDGDVIPAIEEALK